MDRKYSFLKGLMLYMIFWIILAEKLNIQVILIGLLITVIIGFYSFKMKNESIPGKRYQILGKSKLRMDYILLLIKEIIIASIQVAKIVLSRELKISPSVIKFRTRLKKDLSKMILANSITLTPGTLTIEVKGDEFTVHCISKDQIDDVMNSKFEDLLLKIEEQG